MPQEERLQPPPRHGGHGNVELLADLGLVEHGDRLVVKDLLTGVQILLPAAI
jgi:hypothetical protein